jgi:hypothetical protein
MDQSPAKLAWVELKDDPLTRPGRFRADDLGRYGSLRWLRIQELKGTPLSGKKTH